MLKQPWVKSNIWLPTTLVHYLCGTDELTYCCFLANLNGIKRMVVCYHAHFRAAQVELHIPHANIGFSCTTDSFQLLFTGMNSDFLVLGANLVLINFRCSRVVLVAPCDCSCGTKLWFPTSLSCGHWRRISGFIWNMLQRECPLAVFLKLVSKQDNQSVTPF